MPTYKLTYFNVRALGEVRYHGRLSIDNLLIYFAKSKTIDS